MRTDMMNLNKRLEALEVKNRPAPKLEFSQNETDFLNEVDKRMTDKGTNFYHEVCNDAEFERIKNLSTKVGLIWYRNNIHNKENHETE